MKLFDLTNRVAVVTGGGRGIGAMAASGLVSAGSHVVIASRDKMACQQAVERLRKDAAPTQRIDAIQADLSTEDGCRALCDEVAELHDRLDILINNSGATWGAPLEEFPSAGWDKVLDLNLKAPFYLIQHLLPLLAKTATAEHPARVLNIGSVDGQRVSTASNYSYSASKAAIHHLTRVLAVELAAKHITVNAIAPGPFESKMMAHTLREHGDEIVATVPLQRIGQADDIAGAVIYLTSQAGSYVTGAIVPVDGGLAAR